jgi:hypothetical protein
MISNDRLTEEIEIALECDDRDRVEILWGELRRRVAEAHPEIAEQVRQFEQAYGHPPGFYDVADPKAAEVIVRTITGAP